MIKQCYCGKKFITYPSKIKIGKGKYCSKECCLKITNDILEKNGNKTRFIKGQKAHNFRGFTITQSRLNGVKYILEYNSEHKNCDKDGYVRQHRLIIEKKIGRLLDKAEVVHHIDRNGLNNNVDNLQLLTSKEHKIIHLRDTVHKRWYN